MNGVVLSLWRGETLKVRRPRMADIVAAVADKHDVTVADLKGPSRVKHIVAARFEAMARMYDLGIWSMPQIGRFFGRDHTTVLNGIRRHHGASAKRRAA